MDITTIIWFDGFN